MKPTQKPSTNVNGPRPPRLAGLLGITDLGEVTPAEILRGAACYLQLHGWHQGSLYADENPTNLTPAACAQGGMGMAAFGKRIPDTGHNVEMRDFRRASAFFNDYLNLVGAKPAPTEDQEEWEGPSVGDWNDDPDRTFTQVHAALLAAADEWERTHAPLPVLNLPGGDNA
ncbi:DUF6197 family protein [Phytohabitans sp. LJ34]|uniref:DUF6197 family protein n=1 Tax=Phytohabitans sp. LJ34 TaxID=3452217 RepID=UPI003F88C319